MNRIHGLLLVMLLMPSITVAQDDDPELSTDELVLENSGPPEWMVLGQITGVRAGGEINHIYWLEVDTRVDLKSCGNTNWFVIPPHVPERHELWGLAQLALVNNRKVELRIRQCYDGYNVVDSIIVR